MTLPIYQVDAFTARPFAGNPAAVCLLRTRADEGWMAGVAAEMNCSETAFLHPESDGWRLRWFTPTREVDLCGHATLASAHILWETARLAPEAEARFFTLSGVLTARRRGGWVEMDFPAEPPRPWGEEAPPPELAEGLGIVPVHVARNRLDVLAVLGREADVRDIVPNPELLRRVPARGIIVTAPAGPPAADSAAAGAGPGYDFVSRFFAPAAGVPEDPVTGSAHCCLGPYWGDRLGRRELTGQQVSQRGGLVRVTLAGDRVLLAGQAVTVLRGEWV